MKGGAGVRVWWLRWCIVGGLDRVGGRECCKSGWDVWVVVAVGVTAMMIVVNVIVMAALVAMVIVNTGSVGCIALIEAVYTSTESINGRKIWQRKCTKTNNVVKVNQNNEKECKR